MWDKPQVLNWIANLLFGLATVLMKCGWRAA